jgi:P pilus assembly chaperone PapD
MMLRTQVIRMVTAAALVAGVLASTAAVAFSYSWGPQELEFKIRPGQGMTKSFRVTNNTQKVAHMQVVIEDWSFDGPSHRFEPAGTLPTSALTWLSVQPERFKVEPGETQVIQVTVSAPPDARGGRFAGLFAATVPPDEDPNFKGWAMTVGARLGVLVPIRVVGTGTEAAELVQASFEAKDNDLFKLAVKNAGDVHLRAGFKAVVMKDGAVVGTLKSQRDTRLLPGQTRDISGLLEFDLENGVYEITGAIPWGERGAEGRAPFATRVAVAR